MKKVLFALLLLAACGKPETGTYKCVTTGISHGEMFDIDSFIVQNPTFEILKEHQESLPQSDTVSYMVNCKLM